MDNIKGRVGNPNPPFGIQESESAISENSADSCTESEIWYLIAKY